MITFRLAQYEANKMESYDQIQGFEYWDTKAWETFVKEHALPLHESASKLLGLREFLIGMAGGGEETLSEVKKKEDLLLVPYVCTSYQRKLRYNVAFCIS